MIDREIGELAGFLVLSFSSNLGELIFEFHSLHLWKYFYFYLQRILFMIIVKKFSQQFTAVIEFNFILNLLLLRTFSQIITEIPRKRSFRKGEDLGRRLLSYKNFQMTVVSW